MARLLKYRGSEAPASDARHWHSLLLPWIAPSTSAWRTGGETGHARCLGGSSSFAKPEPMHAAFSGTLAAACRSPRGRSEIKIEMLGLE